MLLSDLIKGFKTGAKAAGEAAATAGKSVINAGLYGLGKTAELLFSPSKSILAYEENALRLMFRNNPQLKDIQNHVINLIKEGSKHRSGASLLKEIFVKNTTFTNDDLIDIIKDILSVSDTEAKNIFSKIKQVTTVSAQQIDEMVSKISTNATYGMINLAGKPVIDLPKVPNIVLATAPAVFAPEAAGLYVLASQGVMLPMASAAAIAGVLNPAVSAFMKSPGLRSSVGVKALLLSEYAERRAKEKDIEQSYTSLQSHYKMQIRKGRY